MTTYPVMSTMGVGRGIVFPNDSVWRLQPPATNPGGMVELWNGNSGSTTPPAIMRTGVYATMADGTVWEYAPPNLTKISTVLVTTTWNPSDAVAIVLSNGNLTATNSSLVAGVRAAAGFSSGKYYWECTMTSWPTSTGIGIASASANLSLIYSAATQAALVYASGSVWYNGSSASPNLGTRANGDIIGIALDITNSLIWFRVAPSGNWNGGSTANPATGAGGLSVSALTGNLFPAFGMDSSGPNTTANFGASAFSGAVPSGFTAGWGTLQ